MSDYDFNDRYAFGMLVLFRAALPMVALEVWSR